MRELVLTTAFALAACSFEHGQPASVFDDAATGDGRAPDAPRTTGDGPAATADAAGDAQAPGMISCPGFMCGAVCCDGACAVGNCAGTIYRCDGPEDCNNGQDCCNNQDGSYCAYNCPDSALQVCHSVSDCSWGCNDCSFSSDYGQKVCCDN